MIIPLIGRIDSQNAAETEERLTAQTAGAASVVFDANELQYISSAGLRVLLRIRKAHPDMKIVNVHSDVYEILDMTGFTEIMPVEKAYRVVSIEGCEEIGHGANGNLYRIDRDNVVKVYKNPDLLRRHQGRQQLRLGL